MTLQKKKQNRLGIDKIWQDLKNIENVKNGGMPYQKVCKQGRDDIQWSPA